MLGLFSRLVRLITLVGILIPVAACDETQKQAEKKEILAYIGITMAKPMAEIAKIIEERLGVNIIITQGGSEDLYQSLKAARKGDLYLPGSASYRESHFSDGLLGELVMVGYNQASLMVPKGNPKGISANIDQMLRDDVSVVICNPESGSIGRETKKILLGADSFEKVFKRAEYLTTDSRNLNKALRNGDADLIINWRATAFFDENRPNTQVIDLPPEIAKPKRLLLNLLTFSKHPDVARELMAYAVPPQGQAIFRKYGFIDAQGQSEN